MVHGYTIEYWKPGGLKGGKSSGKPWKMGSLGGLKGGKPWEIGCLGGIRVKTMGNAWGVEREENPWEKINHGSGKRGGSKGLKTIENEPKSQGMMHGEIMEIHGNAWIHLNH